MSAFVVSTETMQRVVHACGQYEVRFGAHGHTCADLDMIGNRLYAMNGRAVTARYGEDDDPLPVFKYRPLGQVPLVHMLKATECLTYQCSEGGIPDEPDFKMLETLINRMRGDIVRDLPEYNAAPWDSGWPVPADAPAVDPAKNSYVAAAAAFSNKVKQQVVEIDMTPADPAGNLARLQADAAAGRQVSLSALAAAVAKDRTARRAPRIAPRPLESGEDIAF